MFFCYVTGNKEVVRPNTERSVLLLPPNMFGHSIPQRIERNMGHGRTHIRCTKDLGETELALAQFIKFLKRRQMRLDQIGIETQGHSQLFHALPRRFQFGCDGM